VLNTGWQYAFTASVLVLLIMGVIRKACGGEVEEEAAAETECFIQWDGREYGVDCEENEGF